LHLERNNVFKAEGLFFLMDSKEKTMDDDLEIVIANFQRKNQLPKNESRRDEILALQSHYALKAEEGRLLKRIYYKVREALLRNSYDFNLSVFNWDSRLHREVL